LADVKYVSTAGISGEASGVHPMASMGGSKISLPCSPKPEDYDYDLDRALRPYRARTSADQHH